MNKKVLLIAYYWPPAGGGGVQRWLKMSKYFEENKIDLTIYTPENPEYPAIDEDGLEEISTNIEIIKRPILEPYGFYKKFLRKKKDEKIYSAFIGTDKSWKQKLAIWFRGNFFIPDARMLWIKPSVKYLKKKLASEGYDAIISTGPPHSMHLIALGLKKKFPSIKWIADFRDPWTNIDFYDQLMLSKWADRKHRRLEKEVLDIADKVVTVGWTWGKELEALSTDKTVNVITNGFDHVDFKGEVELETDFSLLHVGSMNKDRNPHVLWKALSQLRTDSPVLFEKINIEIMGQADGSVMSSVNEYQLDDAVTFIPFKPHKEAVRKMKSAHVLLLVINDTPSANGILTGKVFEYLGAGRPILCIGPEDGDMKNLLESFSSAHYVKKNDVDQCVLAIKNLLKGEEQAKDFSDVIMKYSRKSLAKEYANLIHSIA